VWDAQSGAELAVLRGHEGSVESVWYSPDGRRIVSSSKDDTVRVWDAATGECIEVVQGRGDVAAIAAGTSSGLLWRAICRDQECVVEPTGGGRSSAKFPVWLGHITTLPNGRTWASLAGSYLHFTTLEGDPSAPPPEPPEPQ